MVYYLPLPPFVLEKHKPKNRKTKQTKAFFYGSLYFLQLDGAHKEIAHQK